MRMQAQANETGRNWEGRKIVCSGHWRRDSVVAYL